MRRYETSKDYSAAGRATMALRPSTGVSYRFTKAAPVPQGLNPEKLRYIIFPDFQGRSLR
jgi:hypothetical protein